MNSIKRFIGTVSIILAGMTAFAENEVKEVALSRAMNPVYAPEFVNQTVQVKCVFFKHGLPHYYRIPAFLKQGKYVFQCVTMGDNVTTNTLNGEPYGEIFAIDENKAEMARSLKEGDIIIVKGNTKIYSNPLALGSEEVYFMVESIEKAK